MRVYSVMPQLQGVNNNAVKMKKNENSTNVSNAQTLSNAAYVSNVNMNSIHKTNNIVKISFTGNESKNMDQFASYAPENKRLGVKAWDKGGLGVVSYEAITSWRKHEKADARDFLPYHSHDNKTGGIKVAKLSYNPDGSLINALSEQDFYTISSNETLESFAKTKGLNPETLSYVAQLEPENGKAKFLRLEDTGIKGAFNRVSDDHIDELKEINYRLFRLTDIEDTIDLDIKKIKDTIKNEVSKTVKQEVQTEVTTSHAKDMKKAVTTDKKAGNNNAITALNNKITEEVKAIMSAKATTDKINGLVETELALEKNAKAIEKIKAGAAAAAKERNSAYFVHTSGAAQMASAYGDGAYSYAYNVTSNTHYADNCRAFAELLPQLNTPEHGNYNPANIWLHCRPSYMVMPALADLSASGNEYFHGLKVHGTFHNPGRDYQGATDNPFEFFRMVATEKDVAELKKHQQLNILKRIEENWQGASATDRNIANQILKPFLEGYVDETGQYNVTMTPINAVKTNPNNMSAGTVSNNYDKEMKNTNTKDISAGLTKPLSEIKTISITNGSTPANLRLNDPTAGFHRGMEPNLLSTNKAGFTTYKYEQVLDESGKVVSSNIDDVVSSKQKNTKWLLDIMGSEYETGGNNSLSKVFFNADEIKKGSTVIGHLSKYQEGDILLMGWGRPDTQKGFPSSLEAFYNFLKSDAPEAVKQKTKMILGAGVWDPNGTPTIDDFKKINELITKIGEIDGGKYKGNAAYINGFFPNRLVGCATYTIFSSRFEPCGITPLESFASGTPVISTRTGGAPDFIRRSRGYLTENPFLLNPERLKAKLSRNMEGKSANEITQIIDSTRMKENAEELTKCIKDAVYDYSDDYKKHIDEAIKNGTITEKFERVGYKSMVEDSITQLVDWHENAEYNGGKSANTRYMEEVFERGKGWEARDKNPLKRMVSKFGIALDANGNIIKDGLTKTKTKITKVLLGIGAGVALLGGGAWWYSSKAKSAKGNVDSKIPVAKLDSAEIKPEEKKLVKLA